MEASLRHLFLFLRDLCRFRHVSLSPVKLLASRQRGAGGVVSHIIPVGLSPDNKHVWTQLAKWYLGLWKGGGNDPLYLPYPLRKNKKDTIKMLPTQNDEGFQILVRLQG